MHRAGSCRSDQTRSSPSSERSHPRAPRTRDSCPSSMSTTPSSETALAGGAAGATAVAEVSVASGAPTQHRPVALRAHENSSPTSTSTAPVRPMTGAGLVSFLTRSVAKLAGGVHAPAIHRGGCATAHASPGPVAICVGYRPLVASGDSPNSLHQQRSRADPEQRNCVVVHGMCSRAHARLWFLSDTNQPSSRPRRALFAAPARETNSHGSSPAGLGVKSI